MTGGLHLAFAYLVSRPIDVYIDDDHDGQREIEGAQSGVDLVLEVGRVGARAVESNARRRLAPAEQRRYGDERREQPHDQDHGEHELGVATLRVRECVQDDEVAVDADRAQVEYGRCAQKHVREYVQVAHDCTQIPSLILYFIYLLTLSLYKLFFYFRISLIVIF